MQQTVRCGFQKQLQSFWFPSLQKAHHRLLADAFQKYLRPPIRGKALRAIVRIRQNAWTVGTPIHQYQQV